jgi:TatD family-associated radical SAM protein
MDHVENSGGLWLEHEPSVEEVKTAMKALNMTQYSEVVFCGFGEPTERLDTLLEVAKFVKENWDLPTRINTNGLGDLVNGESIAPRLAGLIDTVSISLNTPDADQYLKLTRNKFGAGSFEALLDFARSCVGIVPNVVMTTVDTTITKEEEQKCASICQEIGAAYRIRPWEE